MKVGLFAPCHVLPERRVTTDELAERFVDGAGRRPFSGRVLRRLTGVEERRWVAPGTCSSDLAAAAGAKALAEAGADPADVDLVLFAAASHDVAEPATANRVQALTGCRNARVLDVKNACNSFLDGLDVARALVLAGAASLVLLVTGEVISPFVALEARPPHPLSALAAGLTLGDGAAAVLVAEWTPPAVAEVGVGAFWSAGQHWDASRILGGGSMAGRDGGERFFVSDSARLFALAAELVPPVVECVLEREGWAPADVDLVIPHQASASMARRLAQVVGVPEERCVLISSHLGNMAAASIPVALSIAHEQGRLTPARNILLVGAAAGFSAAAVPLRR